MYIESILGLCVKSVEEECRVDSIDPYGTYLVSISHFLVMIHAGQNLVSPAIKGSTPRYNQLLPEYTA